VGRSINVVDYWKPKSIKIYGKEIIFMSQESINNQERHRTPEAEEAILLF